MPSYITASLMWWRCDVKKSSETDRACISRMLNHIQTIGSAYEMFGVNSAEDLKASHICQLAITQLITNIYELRKRLRDETIEKMPLLESIRLKVPRNIASHDYDKLDLDLVYRRTLQLLNTKLHDEMEAILSDFDSSKQCNNNG